MKISTIASIVIPAIIAVASDVLATKKEDETESRISRLENEVFPQPEEGETEDSATETTES